jgi:DNA invertase Pin-like site-specific DNA recombinase
MRVALYTRVSTQDQTVESQLIELRAECSRRGWEIVADISDTISGSKFTRTGLDQLMKLVRQHAVKAVVCYKLDRLGRSLQHLDQVVAELDTHGVALVCPSQGIDTSDKNPAGRLTAHILMCMAEFQLSLIREATLSGLKAARARGVKLGRPSTALPVDYRQRVAKWRADTGGKGYRKLAEILGVKNPGIAFRVARELASAHERAH